MPIKQSKAVAENRAKPAVVPPVLRPLESKIVYGIADQAEGLVRYVGATKHYSKAVARHMRLQEESELPLYAWMRTIRAVFIVLHRDGDEVLEQWEIERRLQRGDELFNVVRRKRARRQ